jgi:parallel beta-helix repeat protein
LSKVNSFTFNPGDEILFRRGQVWRGGLTIRGNGITIGSYGSDGEFPILSGAVLIAPRLWSHYGGDIYVANVGFITPPTQLYVDGNFCEIARHPNFSYSTTTSNSTDNRSFIDSTLSRPSSDYVGATLFARSNNWSIDTLTVANFSSGDKKLTTSSELLRGPMLSGWGYILQGKLWMLDRPNEWLYDPSEGKIYLRTNTSDNPATHDVEISSITNIIESNGFSNVTIQDLSVQYANEHNVHLSDGGSSWTPTTTGLRALNLTLKGGRLGVYIRSNNAVIQNNQINNSLWGGIYVHGDQCQVFNNTIDNIGTFAIPGMINGTRGDNLYGSASLSGIGIRTRAGVATISGNTIHNCAFDGIRTSGKVIVENNTIDNAVSRLADGGGIYLWGGPIGSPLIRNNTVTNTLGNIEGSAYRSKIAAGIYLDGNASIPVNFRVENNTVSASPYGVLVHSGYSNSIRGNDVSRTTQGLKIAYDAAFDKSSRDTRFDNLVFGNRFSSTRSTELPQSSIYNTSVSPIDDFGTFNNNSYCHEIGGQTVYQKDTRETNSYSLSQWQLAKGQDRESVSCPDSIPPITPTVDLSTGTSNGNIILNWITFNADVCHATGDWSGTKISSGTEIVFDPPNGAEFNLSCRNANGVISRSVSISSFTLSGAHVVPDSITPTSLEIQWETDAPAKTQIEYGITTDYGFRTVADETLVLNHLQTLSLPDGILYHFRAVSKNIFGMTAVSNDMTITLPDITKPSVAFTAPIAGTTYTTPQTVPIAVISGDNVSVAKVWFLRNNVVVSTDTASPYEYSWPITGANNGAHSWKATAFDAMGNSSSTVARGHVNHAHRWNHLHHTAIGAGQSHGHRCGGSGESLVYLERCGGLHRHRFALRI